MNEYSAFRQGIDNSIIIKAQSGDRSALKQVYESYFYASFKLAYRITASKSASEDIVHNGFIKVLTNITAFKHDGSFAGWLRQIMVNEALIYLRKHKKFFLDLALNANSNDDEEQFSQMLNVANETAFDQPWWEACNDLFVVMKDLNVSARTVLILHEIEGYSHREIAALLGKTESFSKQVLARTMHKLREQIMQEEAKSASNR
jgi:RNA polymerase sigma-70 factor (ECF subfamily)